jgi:predicted RNase H-like HicB family nuclease
MTAALYLREMVKCNNITLYRGERMNLSIEYEQEQDGQWLAEVPELPGVLVYGATAEEAMAKAEVLALRVLAERLEAGETRPVPNSISFATAT